jgi:hypothetical protein
VRSLLTRLRAFFANLSSREQMLVSLVGVLALALIGVLGVLQLLAAGDHLEGRVAAGEQQLAVMERLRHEFDEVSVRLRAVEERIQSGPRGNLRTTLESLAQQSNVKVESMEPQASPAHERYRETKVEVGLAQVTLSQAVNYLHQLEQTPQLLSVKALKIRTRPDKPELLDVTFTVSSFEPI